MKGLPKSELQDGHVYYCLLAQRPVLIKNGAGLMFIEGRLPQYETYFLNDGQLVEYEIPKETVKMEHRINPNNASKTKIPSPMYPVKKVLDDLNDKNLPL